MDRRQQKTRAAIFEAFSELLSKKSYSHITVQEIIDTANIGRTTFYAHFETKDTLLKEMCDDLFGHVFFDSLNGDNAHNFSIAANNPFTIITPILYHIKDNKKNVLRIINGESGELFLGYFKVYLNRLICEHVLSKEHARKCNVPTDFLVNHISSTFTGMVEWWIKNDLKETPEKLVEYFRAVIEPILL